MVFQQKIKSHDGFTMVELIVVMAIAAILMAVVVPGFTTAIQKAATNREINAFVGDLGFLRAEAVKEGVPVTMCASVDGVTCSGTVNWQFGWIIFSNPNLTTTAGAPIRKQIAFTSTDTFVADNATSSITYTSEGFTRNLAGNPVTFTLHTTPVVTTLTQCVAINIAGRHILQQLGTGNCS